MAPSELRTRTNDAIVPRFFNFGFGYCKVKEFSTKRFVSVGIWLWHLLAGSIAV
jgi:hypothetical protein